VYVVYENAPYSLALDPDGSLDSWVSKAIKKVGKTVSTAFKQTVKAVSKAGSQVVAVGKKILPAVASAAAYFVPVVGPALSIGVSAAFAAKKMYDANRANKAAKADMENKLNTAYGTYREEVTKAGYTPVDQSIFNAWAMSGGEGQMPMGAAIAAPGESGGQYAAPMMPPGLSESIVPLAVVGILGMMALSTPQRRTAGG